MNTNDYFKLQITHKMQTRQLNNVRDCDYFQYHLTLNPAVLWILSNDTSRPTCSDSLNLMPPAPLYLRTLRHYTNPILLLFIIIFWQQDYSVRNVIQCNDNLYSLNKISGSERENEHWFSFATYVSDHLENFTDSSCLLKHSLKFVSNFLNNTTYSQTTNKQTEAKT